MTTNRDKTEEQLFKAFLRKALARGHFVVPPYLEHANRKRFGLRQPDVPRVHQTVGQVILEKHHEGYALRIPTSYDPVKKEFTDLGCMWMYIVAPKENGKGKKTLLSRCLYRRGDFLNTALQMMDLLWDCLLRRPFDPVTKELMVLKERRYTRKQQCPYVWVPNRKHKKSEEISFFHQVPKHLQLVADKWVKQMQYYEYRVRPTKGTVVRTKDIRHKWK